MNEISKILKEHKYPCYLKYSILFFPNILNISNIYNILNNDDYYPCHLNTIFCNTTFVTMVLSYLEYIYAHQLKGLIIGEYIHPNICANKHSLCNNVKKRNEREKNTRKLT
jgi:hypothetical protein